MLHSYVTKKSKFHLKENKLNEATLSSNNFKKHRSPR